VPLPRAGKSSHFDGNIRITFRILAINLKEKRPRPPKLAADKFARYGKGHYNTLIFEFRVPLWPVKDRI
jgi:hypothetical protein